MGKLKECPYCKNKHRKESLYKKCKAKHKPPKWPK